MCCSTFPREKQGTGLLLIFLVFLSGIHIVSYFSVLLLQLTSIALCILLFCCYFPFFLRGSTRNNFSSPRR
uniref:Putative ovule protein n=1 Tax=Solanum chacoense TaxID=4108 RepID=A0A0V0H1N3_SOLCH